MTDDGLDPLLARLCADPNARTRNVVVGSDAADRLAVAMPNATPALVVADANTWAAAGERVTAALRAHGVLASPFVFERTHDEDLICDDAAIERLDERLRTDASTLAVAVGGGTINDIVKTAAMRNGRPYLCFPTAASMNGYTSAIAAVLSKGVKRTIPTAPPIGVFADIEVLRSAPHHLAAAGFGDLLSKPFSHADWLLSHRVRGVAYDPAPARLLDAAYERLLASARAIGEAEPDGIAVLIRCLLVSGFSMTLAGTSAPASGGEHLVSHYWDMERHCRGLPTIALHGTQVGIATHLSALLFERLVDVRASDFDIDAAVARRPNDAWLSELPALHPELSDAVVAEIRDQIAGKQAHGPALRAELERVRAGWDETRERLAECLRPASEMKTALARARAAARPSEIGVTREHAVRTLRICRHMRNRYVALDLLDDLGLLHELAVTVVVDAET